MKKNNSLIVLFISIIVLACLSSCGSRKIIKTKLEEKKDSISLVDIKTKIETKENTEINNDIKINKETNELIIEPVDNNKEIIVDGKTYKNVKIRQKNTKDNSLHTNQKKVSKNALKQKTKHNVDIVSKRKVLVENKKEKKESLIKYIYILLIIIILYFIYRNRINILKFFF
jgi:preprotein translocase subunit SecF